MRKSVVGFIVAVCVLFSQHDIYAEKVGNVVAGCFKLTGAQDACPGNNSVNPCPGLGAAGAVMLGGLCGLHQTSYSSPTWDQVKDAGVMPGYNADWSVKYLCYVKYDCTVQNSILGPVCAIDPLTISELYKTKIQLNFDDPCNFTP